MLFFCVLTYAIIYVLIHQIIFRFYPLYFIKYSCTNIFHRRSLYTFYYGWSDTTNLNCRWVQNTLLISRNGNQGRGHSFHYAHINSVTTSANSTLGFIRRNLKKCPKALKELAYLSLVRFKLEYAASVWDPHHTSDTNKLEQVQRRAARFVCNNYSPYSSVTQMLSDLGWQQLKNRRKHIRLALFYKIVHHLTAVPHEDILRKADSRTRSSHNYKYRTLRSHKDPYKISFFPRTILEWNPLPADIVHSDTIHIFKNRLHPAPSQRQPAASSELAASIQLASACI